MIESWLLSEHASLSVVKLEVSPTVTPVHGKRRLERQKTLQKSQRRRVTFNTKAVLLSILAIAMPGTMAQNCIPLSGSKQCPAFTEASIATDRTLVGFFPFLRFVSNVESFDEQLRTYVSSAYVQEKYQTLLGCNNINLSNTTDLYARFTTTVLCNAIVQNSRSPCGLTASASRPVCAETCAQQAESESMIVANSALCPNSGFNVESQIRADFTNCALPANSLTSNCINGVANEPNNCGYGNSTIGLCQYCASGGLNSTDTCCYTSGAQSKCENIVLPTITGFVTFSTTLPTSTSSALPSFDAALANSKSRLSGGAIAGVVIGLIVGIALLAGLVFFLLRCFRRRKGSQDGSVFNQPSPPRSNEKIASATKNPTGTEYSPASATITPDNYEVLPGGRIARMSALESHPDTTPSKGEIGNALSPRRHDDHSSSDDFSMASHSQGILQPPPTGRRAGSLSSSSALGMDDPQSPNSGSGGDVSSPQGLSSQQSEQLPFFKDYYSQDEIHPGDKVATLWAYQPRAADEFSLERGDMLKVVGIWDDGWATGVMVEDRANEWEARRNAQRDSGVSHTSGRREESPNTSGEIKAFPLVCVCLPDHWRKTIEGDGSTETESTAPGNVQ